MNQQRQDAYLNLIQQLLDCPNGEEGEILAANQGLLDAEFLLVVEAVAKMMSEQDNQDTANWLRNLGNELAKGLNLSSNFAYAAQNSEITENIVDIYLKFLLEVLQAMEESKGNKDVVYPLLIANTDKLDNNFAEILWRWATVNLKKAEEKTAEYLATVIGNFCNLISKFPLGDKANNMEIAIIGYEIVLTVFTREAFPNDWARAQNNLGNFYANRILGDKSNNIEKSISTYRNALDVYTVEAFPYEWAVTKNNLGIAYRDRILKDKASNIERSIAALEAALTVRTQDSFPIDWAITQYNLGLAYIERILGDEAKNIEQSITAFQETLRVNTCEAFPIDWAEVQNVLGLAYEERILGDKANNIEQSIAAYKAALTVRTSDDFPIDWSQTQYNLGNAYAQRILGDRANNIEQSIATYEASLTVRTCDAFPIDWTQTQNNLGNAYSQRILGDKVENIETATIAYKKAIDTAELLREQIFSGNEAKKKLAEQWNVSYIGIVQACLELDNIQEAIEYVERSKTRNLVELILERDSKTIFPPEVVTKLEQLRDEIAKGQYQIQNSTTENPKALAEHLQKLRSQRNELQDKYLPVGSGFDFETFQATLDKNTAIIEWYITNTSLETFIITSDNLQRFKLSTSTDKLKAFIDWNNKYLNTYYNNKTKWINNLASHLTQLAEILHIEEILKLIPQNCSHLILIPHRYLHLFPLHALPLSDGGFLCDQFSDGVSYAPSCQLLQQLNLRQRVNFKSLFAIQNPTEDLQYTDLEVEAISSLFTDKEVLSKKQATQTALSQASFQIQQTNYLHFSCHGTFNLISPQNSCLLLAGAVENNKLDLSKCLTLGNLFERDFNLNQCRLVVLSACETGLIDFKNTSDEYIGLPSGLLYAGSSSVVSSLWTVNDLSTSFLTIKFIQNLKNVEDISVPVALNQAQTWLRDATKEDLQEWASNLPLDSTKKGKIRRQLKNTTVEKPFKSPFHWAAFTAVGK
ncbi:CHAT domain-containing protein [Rivularia sp. UHCC 0363]|uniref:CHAT domain-containing protein n=1 Tax=Rivularia sp. UHCC 0363 TaxID=3110244 RepID=UPI002B201D26|nr:CHAT domain-containing protein [Rivularia sp. UHCC 0363]MEA5592980.1 CHAT domain-containing protein [Rivularia sp. UHCC 0363]